MRFYSFYFFSVSPSLLLLSFFRSLKKIGSYNLRAAFPLSAEARVQSQASPCEIYDEHGHRDCSYSGYYGLPLSVSLLHTHPFISYRSYIISAADSNIK